MQKNYEIKKFVGEKVKGNGARIVGMTILYSLILGVISSVVGLLTGLLVDSNDTLSSVLAIITTAISTPMVVGLYKYVINIAKDENASIEIIFSYYQYFGKLFLVGLIGTLAISIGFLLLIVPGVIATIIYMGILYMFALDPTISVKDVYDKVTNALRGYKGQAFSLLLSYSWQYIVAVVVYFILLIINITRFAAEAYINNLTNEKILATLFQFSGTFLIITILFLIVLVVLMIFLTPRLYLAQTKFYLLLLDHNQKEVVNNQNEIKFCSNCGNPVTGKFCTNCGNKL